MTNPHQTSRACLTVSFLRYEIENRLRAVYAQYKIRLCAVFVKYGFGCISRHKRSVKVVFVSKLNQAINMQIDLFTERK